MSNECYGSWIIDRRKDYELEDSKINGGVQTLAFKNKKEQNISKEICRNFNWRDIFMKTEIDK